MMIAVPILVLWYLGHAFLSRFVGTCTMGDTDRFVGGAVVGMPAAVVALVFLLRAQTGRTSRIFFVLVIVFPALVVLCIWIPLAISTGIRGHHLCGPEFDDYLDARAGLERLIPLGHVAIASALLVRGGLNAHRAGRAAQPGVEPAGRLRGRGLTP